MAKTAAVFEGDQSALIAAASSMVEFKKELHRLVDSLLIISPHDDDHLNLDAIDRAHTMLSALRDLKFNNHPPPQGFLFRRTHPHTVPHEFKCPLSKELMRDPVVIASGQTFDRPFIEKWFKAGNRTCPRTHQVLSHTILMPNHLIREMIAQWCKTHGIKFPDSVQYSDDDGLTEADRSHFHSLLEKMSLKRMSYTLSDQKEAAKELRLLTKRMPSIRALFGESPNAISQLLSPLTKSECSSTKLHSELQEDIITTLLNLSIHDSNKKLVAETPMAIPLLMDALRSGTIETRSNAAAAIFTLSALDPNKELIGKSGVLKLLIDLLDEGHALAMKDAASAIFNLCILHENKARAVRDGAVRVILKNIMSRNHVDELLSILAMLSTNQKAIEDMGELDAIPCLFSIIRETSCARNKENCIAILYTICLNYRTKWKVMKEEENMHQTISKLAQNGTSRAKRKANGILERINRPINLTHTA